MEPHGGETIRLRLRQGNSRPRGFHVNTDREKSSDPCPASAFQDQRAVSIELFEVEMRMGIEEDHFTP